MNKYYYFVINAILIAFFHTSGTQASEYRDHSSRGVVVSKHQRFPHRMPADRKAIYEKNKKISWGSYSIKERPGGSYDMEKHTKSSIDKSVNFIKGGKEVIINGKRYDKRQFKDKTSTNQRFSTKYETVNEDSINYGLALKEQGLNPVVMVLANENLPAGASNTGKGNTQEENIAYRTNLGPILHKLYNDNMKNRGAFKDIFLSRDSPRGTDYSYLAFRGGLYVPKLSVLRNDKSKGYSFAEYRRDIDVYVTAAPRHKNRKLNKKGGGFVLVDEDFIPALRDEKFYWDVVKDKIRSMCEAALMNGNDAIVFGAFGVGAFANPKDKMIAAFAEVLKEYDGRFKHVGFPVLDPKGDTFNAFNGTFNANFAPHARKKRALEIIGSINPGDVAKLSTQAKARATSGRDRAEAMKQLIRIKSAVTLLKQDKETASHPRTLKKIILIEQDLNNNFDFNRIDWNRLRVKKPAWAQ